MGWLVGNIYVTASHLAFREDVETFWVIEAAAAGRMTGSQERSILLEMDEIVYKGNWTR